MIKEREIKRGERLLLEDVLLFLSLPKLIDVGKLDVDPIHFVLLNYPILDAVRRGHLGGGQQYGEAAPLSRCALCPDATTMEFDDRANQ